MTGQTTLEQTNTFQPSSLRIPVDENTPISLGASLPQVVCTSQEAASLASLQAVIDRSYCMDFRVTASFLAVFARDGHQ